MEIRFSRWHFYIIIARDAWATKATIASYRAVSYPARRLFSVLRAAWLKKKQRNRLRQLNATRQATRRQPLPFRRSNRETLANSPPSTPVSSNSATSLSATPERKTDLTEEYTCKYSQSPSISLICGRIYKMQSYAYYCSISLYLAKPTCLFTSRFFSLSPRYASFVHVLLQIIAMVSSL